MKFLQALKNLFTGGKPDIETGTILPPCTGCGHEIAGTEPYIVSEIPNTFSKYAYWHTYCYPANKTEKKS